MKKSFTLFCSLLLLFTFLLPAAADVVWEPENDFYKEHLDECFEIHVTYVAQEAVAVVVSPEDHTPVKTIAPGETFYIGGQWGDYWRMLSDESGWLIPINCKRYYNASDFYSDHQDEITKLDKWESISLSDGLILWSFPGSGSYSEIIGMEDIGWDSETYNTIWKDDAGRTWANVWIYQQGDGWVCLDDRFDPTLPETAPEFADDMLTQLPPGVSIPVAQTEEPKTAPQTVTKPNKRPIFAKQYILPIVLVVCVMLVTGVIIVWLSKNKRANASPPTPDELKTPAAGEENGSDKPQPPADGKNDPVG